MYFRYADTTVENFEVWNVRRDVLLANNQLNTPSQPDPNQQPQPRPLPQPIPIEPDEPLTTSTSAPNDQRSTYEEGRT